jgi:hypothetical protein
MKKIVLIITLLICAVSLNAQTPLQRYFKDNKINPNNLQLKDEGYYLHKAGQNFTGAGVCFSLSILSGISIAFTFDGKTHSQIVQNDTYRKLLIGVSGGFFISSIVCFFIGSHQINQAGIIIQQSKNKKYSLVTDGNGLKFNF